MSTLLSLFDGSGGFPLAASLCGITPVAASEVEPYPIAVTRSRFPDMIHLGSVTDINGGEIPPVDIITFGSPCQDLSVAGKRAGLKHEANGDEETTRSGLFMEAIRIIKEMREATNGRYPAFAVWENVPGAFSSNKGEDFRTVLEELIRVVEPHAAVPRVPRAGWAYADSFSGSGWSLAYRVFDAQFWGVPQRRKRIYLVADFRGERAREVLFEREGVRGYFAPGRTPWKGTAPDAEGCPDAGDRAGESAGGTLRGLDAVKVYGIDHAITTGGNCTAQGPCVYEDIQATLKACGPHAVAYSFDSLASNSMKSSNPHSGCRQVEVAKTLATNNDQYRFQPVGLLDSIGGQAERGWIGETAPTLKATHYKCPPLVAMESAGFKPSQGAKAMGIGRDEETAPTLLAGQEPAVCIKECYSIDRPAVAYATDVGFFNTQEDVSPTLLARMYKDPHLVTYEGQRVRYIVRRLTPTECARLQGFPDLWGHPDHKDSLTDEEYTFWLEVRNTHAAINGKQVRDYTREQMLRWYNGLHTDSAEYKLWGNGIALPCALYVMEGIAEELEKEESN